MINDGVNNVPENTIAIFPAHGMPIERLSNIIFRPNKKRDWFTPHFYNCLPLTIANQYGFLVASEFDFEVMWDGGDSPQSLSFYFPDGLDEIENLYPAVKSHFGYGIFTLELPFVFRTPPGVNLLAMAPTNYILPNMTPLAGVVECDNLRFTFTINIRLHIPGVSVYVPKGTPLAALLPIPRFFQDDFKMIDANSIFSTELVKEEYDAHAETWNKRQIEHSDGKANRQYFKGIDTYGNKFKNHQGPSMNNIEK